MTRDQILAFVRRHKLAVEASVSGSGAPQAAVVGYVASDDFELFFDTLSTSRKAENLRRDPRTSKRPARSSSRGWSMHRKARTSSA